MPTIIIKYFVGFLFISQTAYNCCGTELTNFLVAPVGIFFPFSFDGRLRLFKSLIFFLKFFDLNDPTGFQLD